MTILGRLWEGMRGLAAHVFNLSPIKTETQNENNKEVVIETDDYTIIVSDHLPPEANAMALAMYSRSPKSFLIHLAEVLRKGWKKFLQTFYVQYGHKSIGDCGSTTICVERVSMLCAKAIQQYLLYKGQEASTRYLDMTKMRVLNPLGTTEGEEIQKWWMSIYSDLLGWLIPHLKECFPKGQEESDTLYEKTIKAKAFDIARSFLPAGCTTYVGWHSTIREARDHLLELRHHPLAEVAQVAEAISRALAQKYPSSGFEKRYPATEAYVAEYMKEFGAYQEPDNDVHPSPHVICNSQFDKDGLSKYKKALETRPPKTELPTILKKYGKATWTFLLDFGSYRDLQRHRSGIVIMPLLTIAAGFHRWYLEQIPDWLREDVKRAIIQQEERINRLKCTEEERQYYIAMGYKIGCEITFDLPAAVYVAELRSDQTVHPTLRVIAQQIGRDLQKEFPSLALHVNYEQDKWSLKRGNQDIVKK